MILVKSPREIEVMRRAGAVVARFFEEVRPLILPGVCTWDLEAFADRFIARNGVGSAFKGYMGYPAHLCASINEEVVHGIPSKDRVIREGDILSIDFGILREGFYGDSAMTFPVGAVNGVSSRLLAATKRGVGPKLIPGMTLAIEPMVNAGGWPVEVLADGWTVVTCDRSRSAHFEHTVAVPEDGDRILSLP